MFSLHESKQRVVCRVLFVLCAVVPALATLSWILYSHRPWRESDWQATIAQQLHVAVSVGEVTSTRPGVTYLDDVSLAELGSHQPLGRLNRVKVTWRGSELLLEADKLSVTSDNLADIATVTRTALSSGGLPTCQIYVQELEIAGTPDERLSLTKAWFSVNTSSGGLGKIAIQAEIPLNSSNGGFATARVLVEQSGSRASTTLETGGAYLPAWLMKPTLPSLANCTEAIYSGTIRWETDESGTSGSLHGQLQRLSLGHWCGSTDGLISASAGVDIEELKWVGDRLEVARGTVSASSGSVGPQLLARMQEKLYCRPGQVRANNQDSDLEFDELSCAFQLTAGGLTLTGRCQSTDDGAPGCLLARGGQAILRESEYSNLPVALMVQAMAQPEASWLPSIPGSQEANDMAGNLPLPRVGPRPHQGADEEMAARPKDSTSQ